MSNMVVNTNILALNSHRALKGVGGQQAKASQRLSSGLRINTAADDAAGLAISEKMRSQIKGLDQASRNSQDGISLIQTAEGGLTEINNMVVRVRELTVQAANDTNEAEDRVKLQNEVMELASEVTAMLSRVEFNKKVLLDGSMSSIVFQVGANGGQLTGLDLSKYHLQSDVAAVLAGIDFSGAGSAAGASGISSQISLVDKALTVVTDFRAELGAKQNRLEYTIKSLDLTSENLSAAESRIRDADMAKEMMNVTKANVLQQAATSMLAQANQAPQNVLQLLR